MGTQGINVFETLAGIVDPRHACLVVSGGVASMARDAHERSLKNLQKRVIVRRSAKILDSIGR